MVNKGWLIAGYVLASFGTGIVTGDILARFQGFDGPQTVPMVAVFISWVGLFLVVAGWQAKRRVDRGA